MGVGHFFRLRCPPSTGPPSLACPPLAAETHSPLAAFIIHTSEAIDKSRRARKQPLLKVKEGTEQVQVDKNNERWVNTAATCGEFEKEKAKFSKVNEIKKIRPNQTSSSSHRSQEQHGSNHRPDAPPMLLLLLPLLSMLMLLLQTPLSPPLLPRDPRGERLKVPLCSSGSSDRQRRRRGCFPTSSDASSSSPDSTVAARDARSSLDQPSQRLDDASTLDFVRGRGRRARRRRRRTSLLLPLPPRPFRDDDAEQDLPRPVPFERPGPERREHLLVGTLRGQLRGEEQVVGGFGGVPLPLAARRRRRRGRTSDPRRRHLFASKSSSPSPSPSPSGSGGGSRVP